MREFPLKSAMLRIHRLVVPLLFFLASCSLCSIILIRPYRNNKASIIIAERFSLVCSPQCLAVTRYQTGMYQLVMNFVKIDVNSFPVLTLHKERNSKTSLSLSHTHKIDGWEKYMKSYSFCAFYEYSLSFFFVCLIENHPKSNVYLLVFAPHMGLPAVGLFTFFS